MSTRKRKRSTATFGGEEIASAAKATSLLKILDDLNLSVSFAEGIEEAVEGQRGVHRLVQVHVDTLKELALRLELVRQGRTDR